MNLPADQYELYAEFGMAVEKTQVLEVAAGNVALSFMMLFFDRGTGGRRFPSRRVIGAKAWQR